MKILITGTNTLNKGAELMLYAVLKEIESRYPDAEVLFPYSGLPEGCSYIKTSLFFHKKPYYYIYRFFQIIHIVGILRRLNLPISPFFLDKNFINGIDYVLDAGGFQFSDQWPIQYEDYFYKSWLYFLKKYSETSSIIFLPQAFGPFKLSESKKLTYLLSEFSKLIIARDVISYKYLEDSNILKNKIRLYPDFTVLVNGIVPEKFKKYSNFVCIIPNYRMIDKGTHSMNDYLLLFVGVINHLYSLNFKVFLLNHEGKLDLKLCKMISKRIKIPIITGLTALEVKGVISISKFVITSRFHGAISAFNSCLPCIATSWSHKYQCLFDEYEMNDYLLKSLKLSEVMCMINKIIENQNSIKEKLVNKKNKNIVRVNRMWNEIFNDKE
ncbi:MAG: polysaccharide pyruvyl transferase family protein [Candidatus Thermoplasmatota archaeon]|nr:polysaccharide pyruvyl transferase family protein [Candidatus Thermoplasmatota archaeon]